MTRQGLSHLDKYLETLERVEIISLTFFVSTLRIFLLKCLITIEVIKQEFIMASQLKRQTKAYIARFIFHGIFQKVCTFYSSHEAINLQPKIGFHFLIFCQLVTHLWNSQSQRVT